MSFGRSNFTLAGILCLLAAPLLAQDAARPDVCARENVLAILHKVNDYQLAHPSRDPQIDTGHEWSRATYYTGVMAFHRATGDEKLLAQALRWAEEKKWQPGPETPGTNKLTCTQTYLELFFIKRDPKMIAPTIKWVNSGEPTSPSGAKIWYLCWGEKIADSLYVAPPALAMLSEATGEKKYLDYMDAFYWDIHEGLFDAEAGLFYRDKNFIGRKSANGRKVFWSRGNGWVIAGIPRILEHLPKDHPTYARYVKLYKTMAAAVVKAQQSDGLWRANLADPDEFPAKESSGSAFFCYALAWGINRGVLDRDSYLPVVRRAWTGLVQCVSPEGKVQWGQLVGEQPEAVGQTDTHEYVTGTFLLAGSEMLKLSSPREQR
jgi:unsaturated rhamnogalacturonyl hydrolase